MDETSSTQDGQAETPEERALIPLEKDVSPAPTNIYRIPINRQQEELFDTALRDDEVWSRFLLIVSSLGILLIFLALLEVIAGYITLAIAQAIIGAVINGITRLIQNPRRDARERVDKIYNNVIETEKFNAAIQLSATMQGDARDQATNEIINKLIDSRNKAQESTKKQQELRQTSLPTTTPKTGNNIVTKKRKPRK